MKLHVAATAAVAFFAFLLPLSAQNSSLQGVITDDHGASVPGAVVSLVNQETKAPRKEVSTADGAYNFAQVPPGPYSIEVQKPGFKTHSGKIVLQVSTPATLNIKLDVGQVTETIMVTDEVAQVNTQNASIGNPFTEKQIKDLPLQTRNIVGLLGIQPGVAPTGEVLGGKRDQNNVTLDGVDVNDPQTGVNSSNVGFNAALPVPLDSVQEFRTTVAGMGADQGRSSGGQVSLITKSGSNEFHGGLYEYNRNTATTANNWFSNRAGIPRQALVRNQYGASVGGRIIRDRLFFFGNWEDRKDRSATAVARTVPSELFKQGIVQYRYSLNGVTNVGQLTPAQVKAADPAGLGETAYMLKFLQQYPAGNDPLSSPDTGLNFSVLRFNAPQPLDNRVYVAKMDFNVDKSGKHTISVRGTLAANKQTLTGAQFPGQAAAQTGIDNSRGIAVRYTAVLTSSLINNFNYGLTRLGNQQTGTSDSSIAFYFPTLTNYSVRSLNRIAPTHNFVDDLTWTKGAHNFQAGANLRLITNNRTGQDISPAYSFNKNTLKGLGADVQASFLAEAQSLVGGGAKLTETTNVTNAMGALLGILNNYGATFNYGVDGKVIPYGGNLVRSFGTKEYDFYVQDTWKVRSNLTVTYGLRYELSLPPYEKNGVELTPTVGLDQYFADRNGAAAQGIPGYAVPTALVTYNLGGAYYGKPGYYKTDKLDFAPRLSVAYSPTAPGLLGKVLGKGSVLRAGAGIAYDKYGSAMVTSFAASGSPGLATTVAQPLNTDFTTSYRYNGTGLPALAVPAPTTFPYTPPTIVGGFTSFTGVSPNLKAPYSYLLNATYSRPLADKLSLEVGYVGRLSHRGLLLQDFGQPLTTFKDTKSGQTWTQASGIIRAAYDAGLTPAQVKANPSLLPTVPFFENIFGKAANYNFNGSATANYFYTVYGTYGGSDLDALNDMDRLRQPNGQCISVYGCNTFFPLQNAGYTSYVNAGKGAFHGMQVTLRRQFKDGWGFDFNYTYSHSIDNASGAESGSSATSPGTGTVIQDSFNPNAFRGPSDFDIRHNVTTNMVYELPVGKNKRFLKNAPGWLNQVVGGWQLSMLGSYRTGTPLTLSNAGLYPTNYLNSALAIYKPGAAQVPTGLYFNAKGNPSLVPDVTAVNSFEGQYPGQVGTRGILRGVGFVNTDMALSKFFKLPWEKHTLQLRVETFNTFNNVNFNTPGTSIQSPSTFGQFTAASDARVMQFALKYAF